MVFLNTITAGQDRIGVPVAKYVSIHPTPKADGEGKKKKKEGNKVSNVLLTFKPQKEGLDMHMGGGVMSCHRGRCIVFTPPNNIGWLRTAKLVAAMLKRELLLNGHDQLHNWLSSV